MENETIKKAAEEMFKHLHLAKECAHVLFMHDVTQQVIQDIGGTIGDLRETIATDPVFAAATTHEA